MVERSTRLAGARASPGQLDSGTLVPHAHCPVTTGAWNMPRELIEPHKGDKRYIRRKKGKFTNKQVSVGRSLAADRRSKAKRVVKKGEGDRGDVRRST